MKNKTKSGLCKDICFKYVLRFTEVKYGGRGAVISPQNLKNKLM